MGRLWDMASRPYDRGLYKGDVIPDYFVQSAIGDTLCLPPVGSLSLLDRADTVGKVQFPEVIRPARSYGRRGSPTVNVNNGFWSQLMPRDQAAIDITREVPFQWAQLAGGGIVNIFQRRVPRSEAWHIDNFYFFARALGGLGAGSSVLLGPSALMDTIVLRVFISSAQVEIETISTNVAGGVPLQISVPFLNDRVGPREAKFGITLFDGEVLRAYIQARPLAPAPVPPPYALLTVGFRCMGIKGPKIDIEDYLRYKRWDS